MLLWCIAGRIVTLLDRRYLDYTTGIRHFWTRSAGPPPRLRAGDRRAAGPALVEHPVLTIAIEPDDARTCAFCYEVVSP
jgi:hypothetical protein